MSTEIVELYWVAVHQELLNVGLKMEVDRALLVDGYPAPPCPLSDCPIENHRMILVDPDLYEALMDGCLHLPETLLVESFDE